MGDERGDVAQLSVSPVSCGNLTGEALSENTGDGNQAEGSYGGGDAGEIMVEVVGSEVLVDGVSGHKEGDFESGEIRVVEGHVWSREESDGIHGTRNLLEHMDVSMKEDGDKVVESEWKVTELLDKKGSDNADLGNLSSRKTALTEGGVDCALPSGDVGASGNNPGNDAVDVLSSKVEFSSVQTTEVRETDAVAVSNEKINKDEPVDGTAACLKLECSHVPAQSVVDGEVGKEDASAATDNAMSYVHSGADFGMLHVETGVEIRLHLLICPLALFILRMFRLMALILLKKLV